MISITIDQAEKYKNVQKYVFKFRVQLCVPLENYFKTTTALVFIQRTYFSVVNASIRPGFYRPGCRNTARVLSCHPNNKNSRKVLTAQLV